MVWDVEERVQRNRAMADLQTLGFSCDIPPRRLGDRFTFRVAGVSDERRDEVIAVVLGFCPSATLQL